jgi:aspartyl-tRNA(Asn)/glutamyl-tRNA(Gln) amidotransferase subunit A
MTSELHYLSIGESSRAIAQGTLSPVELCQAALARVEETNSDLRAFLTITGDAALDAAKAAERAIHRGAPTSPLHGVPYALKDVYDTAGLLTTCHSAITADRVPTTDAHCAARLREAGGILIGKLATHEFATGGPSYDIPWPPARNPWRLDRFPGGSSSGAAAAVAAGLVPGAMGSDTGGSIRLPAAYCGLVGLKPTFGRVSKRGVMPLSWTLDNCGPLTWTVEDAAILLQIIAGHDPLDPGSNNSDVPNFSAGLGKSVKGMRIGIARGLYEGSEHTASDVIEAMDQTYAVLRDLGAELVEVELPSLETYQACYRTIVMSEAFALHEQTLRTRASEYGSSFRYRILPGALIDASDYVSALRMQRDLRQQTLNAFASVDVLISATTGTAAPVQHRMSTESGFRIPPLTIPFNIAQCPAISLCNGFSKDGLPLSMQIAGPPFEEARILQVAAAYEHNTQWRASRPQLLRAEEQEVALSENYDRVAHDAPYAILARRRGLALDEQALSELSSAMAATDDLIEHVRLERTYLDEPGPTFSVVAAAEADR